MSNYETGESELVLSDHQLDMVSNCLKEFFGAFRLYAIDYNGNTVFLGEENSGMEALALQSFLYNIERKIYKNEVMPYPIDDYEDDEDV